MLPQRDYQGMFQIGHKVDHKAIACGDRLGHADAK